MLNACGGWLDASNPPERYKYVIVRTPHCRYPVATAFFNGVDWRSADDKDEILNVAYYAHIITENLPDVS